MRSPTASAGLFAPFALAASLALAGCNSKTPEVDTAEVTPAPGTKVEAPTAPTPAATPTPTPEPAPK